MVVILPINGLCRERFPFSFPAHIQRRWREWKQVERDSFHPQMPMNKGIQKMSGGVEENKEILFSWVISFNKG
jgi:hypothetical protein